MDAADPPLSAMGRRSSSTGRGIYRRDSNLSTASFVTEVEMAQEEVRFRAGRAVQ
jgi:hypothetical protein